MYTLYIIILCLCIMHTGVHYSDVEMEAGQRYHSSDEHDQERFLRGTHVYQATVVVVLCFFTGYVPCEGCMYFRGRKSTYSPRAVLSHTL